MTAITRALESCLHGQVHRRYTLYGQNTQSQREQTSIARGLAVASAGAPLGNTTDNSSILTQQGFQAIKERFKLLDSARKILDGERTQHCFYNRVDKNDGVGVTFNKFRNKANYTNVMRCANAWGCPVCAAIISEHRKCEVKEAMDWWKKQGGSVLLLTLTVPHYSDTDIKQLKRT